MAESINAHCSVCGKGYYKCLSCRSMMQSQPWKQYTDTSEHYKIHQVIRGYVTGVYDKGEARERLQQIDLSDLEELRVEIREVINEIMTGEDAPAVVPVVEPVAEEVVEEVVNPEPVQVAEVKEEVEVQPVQPVLSFDKRQMFNKNKKRH